MKKIIATTLLVLCLFTSYSFDVQAMEKPDYMDYVNHNFNMCCDENDLYFGMTYEEYCAWAAEQDAFGNYSAISDLYAYEMELYLAWLSEQEAVEETEPDETIGEIDEEIHIVISSNPANKETSETIETTETYEEPTAESEEAYIPAVEVEVPKENTVYRRYKKPIVITDPIIRLYPTIIKSGNTYIREVEEVVW